MGRLSLSSRSFCCKNVELMNHKLTVLVGGSCFIVRKECLMSLEYFRAMLSGYWLESEQHYVKLCFPFTKEVFEVLYNFCLYDRFYDLSVDIGDLYQCLDFINFSNNPERRTLVVDLLKKSLNCSNIFRIYSHGNLCSDNHVVELCLNFFCKRFGELAKSKYFLDIRQDHLLGLLQKDDLVVKSEMDVLRACNAWINRDYEDRRHMVYEILQLTRMSFVSREFIRKFSMEIACKDSIKCKLFLQYHMTGLNGVYTKKQQHYSRCYYPTIYIFDHINCLRQKSEVQFFKYWPNLDKKEQLFSLSAYKNLFGFSAVILHEKLYLIGGNGRFGTRVIIYDCITNTSCQTESIQPSCKPACCSYKEKIYIFTGQNKFIRATSCYQVYCPIKNTWRYLKTEDAFGQSAKAMNDCIILLNRLSFCPSQVEIRVFYPEKNICKKLEIQFCTKMLREIFVYENSIFFYFPNCWKKCKLTGTKVQLCDSKVIQAVINNKKLVLYYNRVLSVGNRTQFTTSKAAKLVGFNLEQFRLESYQVSTHFNKPLEAVLFMGPLSDDSSDDYFKTLAL